MKIIQKADLSEVLKSFDQSHVVTDGTNEWAREMLVCADEKFHGQWYKVRLDKKDVLNTLLVYHQDPEVEGVGIPLIPRQGATVRQVIARWPKVKNEYKEKNNACFEKIIRFGKAEFSPIFLSTKPLTEYDQQVYEKLEYHDEALVHLDGTHRLIAWTLAGRFNPIKYYFSKKKLEVFVAGPLA